MKNQLKSQYDYIYIPTMPGHGDKKDKFKCQETLDYVIKEYDLLKKAYNKIDVLGYSIGGVLACYLSLFRKIEHLILISPAFYYINYQSYKPSIIKKSHIEPKNIVSMKKIQYFFVFSKIVRIVKDRLNRITAPVCILWGEDDFLVSSKSGYQILQISTNEVKYYITLKNLNHYNIVYSKDVADIIIKFVTLKNDV